MQYDVYVLHKWDMASSRFTCSDSTSSAEHRDAALCQSVFTSSNHVCRLSITVIWILLSAFRVCRRCRRVRGGADVRIAIGSLGCGATRIRSLNEWKRHMAAFSCFNLGVHASVCYNVLVCMLFFSVSYASDCATVTAILHYMIFIQLQRMT